MPEREVRPGDARLGRFRRVMTSGAASLPVPGDDRAGRDLPGPEALRIALVNLRSVPAPAGVMDVVLGPGWPGILLHEAVGHGLEGDFNRKGASAFAGLMGQRVAAPGVTVVDDGTLPDRRGSITVDDEGTPPQRNVLIEDGILVGYLQDRQNARAAQMNGFASKPLDWSELQTEIARCLGLTAETAATTRRPRRQLTKAPIPGLIDWARARQRWGDETQLVKAIRAFCADNRDIAELANPEHTQAQAHRIKGAAANLGLSVLASIAGRLEQSHTSEQAQLIAEMENALTDIVAELDQHHPEVTAAPQTSPLKAPDIKVLRALEQAYRHGSFDEEGYAALATFIAPNDLSTLDDALDQFDFDAAAALVGRWINHYSPNPED